MTDDATDAFDAHAPDYDASRRRLVPRADEFYAAAVAVVPAGARRVLDLGAGTGALSVLVAERCPEAELVLLDGAPTMLDQARERLGERATYVVGDLRDPLPDGPWEAIVSALAIHHLADDDKRALLRRVAEALPLGGVFVNAEQIAGATHHDDAAHRAHHEAHARAAGVADEEWAAAQERMTHDRCATADDQLQWLREAGFARAESQWADGRFAVLVGIMTGG